MSSAIPGKLARIKISTNVVAEQKGFTINPGQDEIDVTNLDSNGWREILQGIKSWAVSGNESNFIPTDTNGQTALWTAYNTGTPVTIDFYINSTVKFSGSAYPVPSFSTAYNDVAKVTWSFTGTGALTPTFS